MKYAHYYSLVTAFLCSVCLSGSTYGAFIEMDPDNDVWFSQNGVIDGHGVTIRSWTGTPPTPLSVWDQAYQKLYVRSPYSNGVPALGMEPSTGGLMFGSYAAVNQHFSTRLGGSDGYIHFLFDSPTDFVGIDLCWPVSDWTEGAVVHAWAEDAAGVETLVFSRIYDEGAVGTHTPMNLFHPDITRIRISADDKHGFAQRYFGLDNLKFIHSGSASALHLEDNETIVAPDGLSLGEGDSLSGQGTVEGSLFSTGATVSPGSSPGSIVVTGDYGQDSTSHMHMEIGDGLQDHLQIDGTAMLDGTLEISLLPGFTPEVGQIFTLINYGDRQGEFGEVLGLDFGGGLFVPTYGPDGFYLSVIPEPATLTLLVMSGLAMIRHRRI